MNTLYDYKKFAILYVDDEERSLRYFSRAFNDQFTIFTAPSAAEGQIILDQHRDKIGLIMTDQRMPGVTGVQFLEAARLSSPKIIRILATAYADMDAAVAAVNTGAVYKYVHKPWDVPELEMTLRRGLEFFLVQRERDHLLKEKLSVLHNIMMTDRVVSLGVLAAGLGHHIRNSLVAIRTFLDLAPDKMRDEKFDFEQLRNPSFWQDFYVHVQRQIKKITEMLADLGLAVEVPRNDFQDSINLQEVVQELLESFRPRLLERQITVENLVPAGLPVIKADRRRIRRMFELVLQDELTTLPAGGAISIAAEKTPDNQVKIVVHDNGPGLPKEALRLLFDPFYARSDHPQEFGLNLMACYFIVYHHGGKVEVQSDATSGTTFTFTLPLDPFQVVNAQEQDFLSKVLTNETLWEKLMAGQ